MSESKKRAPSAWNLYFKEHINDDIVKDLKPKEKMAVLATQFKKSKEVPGVEIIEKKTKTFKKKIIS